MGKQSCGSRVLFEERNKRNQAIYIKHVQAGKSQMMYLLYGSQIIVPTSTYQHIGLTQEHSKGVLRNIVLVTRIHYPD